MYKLRRIYFIAAALSITISLSLFFMRGDDALVQSLLAQSAAAPAPSSTQMPSATAIATPIAADATPVAALLPDSRSTPSLDKLERYDGIPVGFTGDGDPFMGDPDAPVTIFEFSDYLCPFCGRHFSATLPTVIDEYVLTGRVQYVFLDYPIAALHPTAALGHVSARCVGEQGAARYWAMHDALFSQQSALGDLSDPSRFLKDVAESLDVDMAAYATCLKAGDQAKVVNARIDQGKKLGVSGTPTFDFVRNEDGARFTLVGANPYATYAAWLDALLAGDEPPITEEPKPELPYWASVAGLAPDPDRPGFTMAGDPFKGNPDALLTIVEFSDFQCPACATHANEVQPLVDTEVIETGAVRWVFKNFPLRSHARALAAAAAAECAADQGQFWPMHHLLFASQEDWAVEEVDAALAVLAEKLELDVVKFMACTTSRQALERVLPDMYDAQGVVDSTPTFVFLDGGEAGAIYRGARDAADFVGLVERFIETLDTQEVQP